MNIQPEPIRYLGLELRNYTDAETISVPPDKIQDAMESLAELETNVKCSKSDWRMFATAAGRSEFCGSTTTESKGTSAALHQWSQKDTFKRQIKRRREKETKIGRSMTKSRENARLLHAQNGGIHKMDIVELRSKFSNLRFWQCGQAIRPLDRPRLRRNGTQSSSTAASIAASPPLRSRSSSRRALHLFPSACSSLARPLNSSLGAAPARARSRPGTL